MKKKSLGVGLFQFPYMESHMQNHSGIKGLNVCYVRSKENIENVHGVNSYIYYVV